MTTNQFFLEATDHFYKNQYEKGLRKINLCLQLHPHNSTLLANRALFYSQIGHLEKAVQQLEDCIQLDYQNYIPYFNLFSLKVRKNQLSEALKELACSLSCLYLTRARFRKRDQDAKESIKYAKNNVQAHVLRAMMLLQSKKLKQCMNELDWAYEFDQKNTTLNKIRSIVQKKLGIAQKSEQSIKIQANRSVSRLICSYQAIEEDLMIQIRMKMQEFNSIYNDLNEENGIVTHRVPRTLLPEQIQKLLTDNQLRQQIQQLYQLKYNPDDTSEPVIYQMKEEYRVQNQIEFEERLKEEDEQVNSEDEQVNSEGFSEREHEEDNEEMHNSKDDNEEMHNSSLMDKVDYEDQVEISKMAVDLKDDFLSDANKDLQLEEEQVSQGEFNEFLVVDEYPQFPPIPEEHSQSKLQPSQSAITQSKYEYFESSVSSRDVQQPVNLYPMKQKLHGRFKLERLEIHNPQKITDFFSNQSHQTQILNHNEMYCVSTYFKQKPGYKVTTCDQPLFFNSDSRTLECEWNQTFKEILLTQDPEPLSVKIYAKNTNSYMDDLVGVGSKVIESSGEITVPIVSASDSLQKLGSLYVRLFLMDK